MSLKFLFKSMLRRKLVVALLLLQLAVTMALIVNSSLLALYAHELLGRDTGLDLDNTLTVRLKLTSPSLYEEPTMTNLLEQQLAALQEINGVVATGYANDAPLKGGGRTGEVHDLNDPEHIYVNQASIGSASPGIFKALNLKVIEGETPQLLDPLIDFTHFDHSTFDVKTRSVVITKSLAKRLYGDQPAVGHYTDYGRIVAVVSDFTSLLEIENSNYHLYTVEQLENGRSPYSILVRVQPGMADKVRALLADKLRAVNSNIDIIVVRSMADQRDELYSRQTGLAILLTTLAVLMLVVAMISAYSNAFFHALKQQQEIGIKRALGASQGLILHELFTEAWLTTAVGCVLGVVACVALNKLLASVLTIPGVPLWLPNLVIAMLLICVTLATWYPAKVATTISPVSATKSL